MTIGVAMWPEIERLEAEIRPVWEGESVACAWLCATMASSCRGIPGPTTRNRSPSTRPSKGRLSRSWPMRSR